MKKFLLYLTVLIPLSCQSGSSPQGNGTTPPSHQLWNELLNKNVDAQGMVDYEGFIRSKQQLQQYLDKLSNTPPDPETWSDAEQLAYWINAYNAFTVKLIIDNYPVESITALHPTLNVPGLNTVWHKKFFKIGGQESSLDEIEHDILRKQFKDPRIHFAIVCASFSCPPLRQEAYNAQRLDSQLEEQAVRFINDPRRNKLSTSNVQLSKIFRWFREDFTRDGSLISFLNRYANTKLESDAKISYLDYDWKLNKQ
ncbi:MAG: DUF547 domain-containing protein [Fulvivirga sp.]